MTEGSSVIRIPRELDERLDELATKTGRRKTYYATKAIAQYLEDREDYLLAVAALEESKGNRTHSLEEVMKRLGLEDKIRAPRAKARRKSRKR